MTKPVTLPLIVDASKVASGTASAAKSVEAMAKRMAAVTGGEVDAIKAKLLELERVKLTKKSLTVDADVTKAKAELEALTSAPLGGIGKLKQALGGELKSAVSSFTSGLGPAGAGLDSLAASAGTAGIATAGIGIAVVAAGKFLQKSVGDFTQLAAKVDQFSRVTRASAEDSSRLIAALDDLGISAEAGTGSFAALSRNLDSKKFKDLNIEIARTSTGATDLTGTFRNVLVALEKIPDPIQRANVLTAAFGKSYADILPLIERGAAGFDKLVKGNEKSGQILSATDLKNAREFKEAVDDLQDSLEKVFLVAGKAATPILTFAAKEIVQQVELLERQFNLLWGGMKKVAAVSFNAVIAGLQALVDAVDATNPIFNFDDNLVAKKFEKIGNAAFGSGLKFNAYNIEAKALTGGLAALSAGLGDAAEAQAAAAKEQEAAAKKLETQTRAVLGLADAQHDAVVAVKAITDHTKEQADAADRAAKTEDLRQRVVTAGKAVSAGEAQAARDAAAARDAEAKAKDRVVAADKAVAKAQSELEAAIRAGGAAAAAVMSAEEAYQRVLHGVGTEADTAKNALLGLNDAKLGASSAEIGVRDAQRGLDAAKRRRQDALDGNSVDAQRQRLQLQIADSLAGVRRAEAALDKVKADGTASTEDIADAERSLARARLDSARDVTGYNRELEQLADLTDEQASLDDEVARAEISLTQAKNDLAKATDDVAEKTRVYNGEVTGFPEDSKEAIASHDKLAEKIRDQSKAEGDILTKTDGVTKAQQDRKTAGDDLAKAHEAIATGAEAARDRQAELIAQWKNAKGDLATFITETGKLATKNTDVATAVGKAITEQANFITKSAEAEGKVISYVDAIRLAVEKLNIELAGSPEALDALGKVAAKLPNSINAQGGVGTAPYGPSSKVVGVTGEALAKLGINEADGSASQFLGGLKVRTVAWCQAFVNKIFADQGVALPNNGSLSTRDSFDKLVAKGLKSSAPVVGGLAYRTRPDGPNGEELGHVGIVVAYDPKTGKITTVEGNTSGGAVAKKTSTAKDWDLGFINPYTSGIRKFGSGGSGLNPRDLADALQTGDQLELSQEQLDALGAQAATMVEVRSAVADQLQVNRAAVDLSVQQSATLAGVRQTGAEALAAQRSIEASGALQASILDVLADGGLDAESAAELRWQASYLLERDQLVKLYDVERASWAAAGAVGMLAVRVDGMQQALDDVRQQQYLPHGFAAGAFAPYRPGGTRISGVIGEADRKGEFVAPYQMLQEAVRESMLSLRPADLPPSFAAAGGGTTIINIPVQAGLVASPQDLGVELAQVLDSHWKQQGRFVGNVLVKAS